MGPWEWRGPCGLKGPRWPAPRQSPGSVPVPPTPGHACPLTGVWGRQQEEEQELQTQRAPPGDTGAWAEASGSWAHRHVVSLPPAQPSVPAPPPERAPVHGHGLPLEGTQPAASCPPLPWPVTGSSTSPCPGLDASFLLRVGGRWAAPVPERPAQVGQRGEQAATHWTPPLVPLLSPHPVPPGSGHAALPASPSLLLQDATRSAGRPFTVSCRRTVRTFSAGLGPRRCVRSRTVSSPAGARERPGPRSPVVSVAEAPARGEGQE